MSNYSDTASTNPSPNISHEKRSVIFMCENPYVVDSLSNGLLCNAFWRWIFSTRWVRERTSSQNESLLFQQIFTLLWAWYVFVFFCNIYSLILWIVRLSSYRQQYNFIHSRLVRTSRPEIPRFRFDFKHADWELGDHVQEALVNAFLTEYLEADGYFFIRLLTANASDFVVQEILEQLWTMYVMKYGEIDATRAEQTYFEYRHPEPRSSSIMHISSPSRRTFDPVSGANNAKRKSVKPDPHQSVALLDASTDSQPVFRAIPEQDGSV